MALSISALPDDAQLAILARVPYADLRIGVAATCKTWSQFVTSTSLRATRTAAEQFNPEELIMLGREGGRRVRVR